MHEHEDNVIELKLIEVIWKALDAGLTSSDVKDIVDQALQVWEPTA